MKTYREPARDLPVAYEADVIVAGAGPAGLIAAVAARRSGAEKVLLVEKHGFLGGMMTAGGVMNIRQYNDRNGGRHDDDGKLVIAGIPLEFADLLRSMDGCMLEADKHDHVRQEPEICKYAAQKMCEDSGVELLLHTMVAGAVTSAHKLEGIIVENKSGRQVLSAKVVVDATGDGDVIACSGADFVKDDRNVIQPMTLAFVLGNAAVGRWDIAENWPQLLTPEQWDLHKELVAKGKFPVRRRDFSLFAGFHENEVYVNATRWPGDATDAWELTSAELECRRQMFGIVDYLRKYMKGYENCYVKTSAAQVGLRETRRLCGVYTLTRQDIESYTRFDDAVMRNNYMVDMHMPDEKTIHTPLERGRYYTVPYRCLVPRDLDGLLAAGRNISATREGMASGRVMAAAMALGQAAGTAAALAADAGIAPRNVDTELLREKLREQNALL